MCRVFANGMCRPNCRIYRTKKHYHFHAIMKIFKDAGWISENKDNDAYEEEHEKAPDSVVAKTNGESVKK
ncbi:hypothetical protein AgCh_017490 [Apium graveolens]